VLIIPYIKCQNHCIKTLSHNFPSVTDINEGILFAVDMLTSEKSEYFPDMSMIILLTDGRPSSGVYWLCIV